jgi:PKD repeat protein
MKYLAKPQWMLIILLGAVLNSCGDDETDDVLPVIANFNYEVQGLRVAFENTSENGTSYLWDFGDGNTSTEENPAHVYATGGDFTVTLVVTGNSETAEKTSVLTIIEPIDPFQALTGGSTKTWVLSTSVNAINFGPIDNPNIIWWGSSTSSPNERSCLWNNQFSFSADGSYNRNVNGDIWKEWKVFDADSGEGCLSSEEEALNKFGESVEEWKDGDFTFEIIQEEGIYYLETQGKGGYVGHYTAGVESSNFIPNDLHKYEITSIDESRIELTAFGWGGDSNEFTDWDPEKPDRIVRLVLVPEN